ncbi:class D beta-lactamase [Enterovirga rhinocerotis]|uniref:Beta-lactamase n=1 Tax=Enterovirga rhinocerotis TaxID=1339210 RepID=A0A4R7C962_9HYPH|nr:class D beta-lactamase [Enterovirga rhinocerotis]TDR93865.1 beta-lactamase class D [Enterovirga rhinocerotis]
MRHLAVLLVLLASAFAAPAQEPACSLVVDAATGAVVERQGLACAERVTPASTFKVPLALIGFEEGILQDSHAPVWTPQRGDETLLPSWKGPVDPTIWERDSVVWYSQELTRRLGMKRFQGAVDRLAYGNRDLSGQPGRDDGLTHAWLSSSLAISPEEQIAFLRKLLSDPSDAAAKTLAIMPDFGSAPGWTLRGKTGSGFARRPDGSLDRVRQIGWFVGIAERGAKRLVFARLIRDEVKTEGYGGPRARDAMLAHLKDLLARL